MQATRRNKEVDIYISNVKNIRWNSFLILLCPWKYVPYIVHCFKREYFDWLCVCDAENFCKTSNAKNVSIFTIYLEWLCQLHERKLKFYYFIYFLPQQNVDFSVISTTSKFECVKTFQLVQCNLYCLFYSEKCNSKACSRLYLSATVT